MQYISTMSTESRCLRPNRALLIFLIYHQHGISGKGHPSTPLLHIRQRRRDSKSHHKTLFFTTSFASSCRRLSFARRRTQQLQLRQHELGDQQMTKRVVPKINRNIGFFRRYKLKEAFLHFLTKNSTFQFLQYLNCTWLSFGWFPHLPATESIF